MRASYCCLLFRDLQVLACIAIKDSILSKTYIYIYLFVLESLINYFSFSTDFQVLKFERDVFTFNTA